ncbi:gliding motility-associated ABC transporter substrate-binding protein GldG [Paenimyroides tangerinum]|uniref:Gliding motility-associated ABC transporter substrate-binding protein GldG n=1 Tax=Paenimyroides tangerinum TaxID=2488728 RepID=A0A3P3WFJ9_9FLAO|nr:gliding motility-associated ABC transporter substrate-binding protein GldG [Paenimyroides tangerinum]RRJ91323.1 gliding motility-associated ABC transporter substrate-binding protein GldG [Paenimyroides tangerinum]
MTGKVKKSVLSLFGTLVALLALNFASSFVFSRLDLTHDNRYTLSEPSLNIISEIQEPIEVEVYLEGNFPLEFRRLQTETKQILEEFSAYNDNIVYKFVNPIASEENSVQVIEQMYKEGYKPISVTVNDKGKQSQEVVFPWAKVTFQGRTARIPLLKNAMGASTEDKVNTSVQHLEYTFVDAFNKVLHEKSKKIAIIKGIGEVNDIYMADFLMSLRDSYYIAPFTLDSVSIDPKNALAQLKEYDLAIIAKPSKPFSEDKIQVLDQYVMNGGKSLWMLDQVQAEMDSLSMNGSMLAYPKDQSLGELLFKYGIRLNPNLVKDEMGTPIKLATGQQGSETVYEEFTWKFAPFAMSSSNHPIVKNIDGVKFDFANSIDTLKNDIKKTVLLQSSPYSKTVGVPSEVSLNVIAEEVTPEMYKDQGNIPLAVLLEGNFTSVFNNRILPFKDSSFKNKGVENKMVVIADGDIARNQLDQNYEPMELGYDKWTNNLYGNKEFLMNSVNYLLDDTGLINIRTKDVKLPLLNKEEVYKNYDKIRTLIVGLPIVLLIIFGFVFTYLRKKKYTK